MRALLCLVDPALKQSEVEIRRGDAALSHHDPGACSARGSERATRRMRRGDEGLKAFPLLFPCALDERVEEQGPDTSATMGSVHDEELHPRDGLSPDDVVEHQLGGADGHVAVTGLAYLDASMLSDVTDFCHELFDRGVRFARDDLACEVVPQLRERSEGLFCRPVDPAHREHWSCLAWDMTFEAHVQEALARPFEGWDFSWLEDRAPMVQPLPWNYADVVADAVVGAERMLDMGTGGGETLLGIPRRAPVTIADEAYPPNVPIAVARLRPHGIPVVQVEGAPDNDSQDGFRGRLPYAGQVFDCVANRHESFLATEVFRILKPGGRFVTQQVDLHWSDDFYAALGLSAPEEPESWLPLAFDQLRAAGFEILVARRGEEHQAFRDVAALIWYLRAISWSIPDFDLTDHDAALRRIHAQMSAAPLLIRQRRFFVLAERT